MLFNPPYNNKPNRTKTTMKPIIKLTLLLAFLMPVTASAHDFEVDSICYNINGTNVTVTHRGSFYGFENVYSGSVSIPETVTYNCMTYSVTSIGSSAFSYCSGLTSVTIPNSVTSIGDGAFFCCSGLTSVTIPNSVTSIGSEAFRDCRGLTSAVIPNTVSSIGERAFDGTAWYNNQPDGLVYAGLVAYKYKGTMPAGTSITIKEGTKGIAKDAFSGCSGLTSVTIPNSVTSIGSSAFSGTAWYNNQPDGLVYAGLFAYKYKGTMPAGTSITIKDGTKGISDRAFEDCSGLTSVTIGNSVTSIGYSAFSSCSGLTSVTIPNSVTYIGVDAFRNCSDLTSVSIGNSVTSIGVNAFSGCSGLTRVNISNIAAWCNIRFSNYSANPLYYAHHLYMNGTEVTDLIIPDSVTSIESQAFYGCSGLASVTIPNSVTSIGSYAFDGTAWYNNQPDGLVYAGLFAYKYKGTMPAGTGITIKEGTKGITDRAFRNCSGLTSVAIPNSVTSIGNYAFSGCSGLTSVTIPKSVTTIRGYAFYGCSRLSGTLTIPKNVTYIGKQAFCDDLSIEAVTCAAETPPTWNDIAMFTTNVYNNSPLYVPLGSELAYMSDQCWGQFATIIGIEIQDEVLATGISLNQLQMNLQAGGTSQLIATVLPDSTTNKVVTWISSNPEIATVDTTGLVTAVASGTATITATTTDGSNLSASCAVTVIEDLSNYDNYLSMSDTTVMHGETIVIPVKMTNEASIISFQTDIFLPEGLELLQEDGEYIIDPSERMTRTHSIMSNGVSNGSIRVICYSSNYKPFTGNSGDDLFYITVKVSDDAEGDYTIQLKNTLLTNTDFVDLAAPDVAANVNVKAYLLGDANNSGSVTITDVVVTAQYVLELNPQPFVFDAADVNVDGNITVADVSRIAWMVLNPTLNGPLRAPALWNNGDRMSAEDISLTAGEPRRVSILLDNEMAYNAFQLDLTLPEGLTASNFQLTDRAGSHAFDVNTLLNGNIRALCYSPSLNAIRGHEGALLTFDVTAAGDVNGYITVDGIELVTADCRSVRLDAFTIGVNNATVVNESMTGKAIAKVEYFNLAGQRMEQPATGVSLVVTTYTDGSRTAAKVIK